MVLVRYIVTNTDAAVGFYTKLLGFELVMHPSPGFAMLSKGELSLALNVPNTPGGGGSQPMPDGTQQTPGGWNRISIQVDDLESTVTQLRKLGAQFRNEIVVGTGGKQILVVDPSGNLVELFEPFQK